MTRTGIIAIALITLLPKIVKCTLMCSEQTACAEKAMPQMKATVIGNTICRKFLLNIYETLLSKNARNFNFMSDFKILKR